ncbi:MAG: hypothetical protein WD294_15065 [Phycisphaeraceae bacterium]
MARRRRQSGVAISFFAFQDVMMGVMGVIILVALLLALSASEVIEMVVDQDPAETSAERATLADLEALADKERQLEEAYESALGRSARLAELGADPVPHIERATARLEQLDLDIEERTQEIARRQDQLPAHQNVVAEELDTLSAMQADRERLEAKVEHRRTSRLSYIIQEGAQKQPVLIVVSAKRFKIGTPGDEDTAIVLQHRDVDTRLRYLREILQDLNSADYYCLLVLKPSGFGDLDDQVRDEVRAAGLQWGLDPVPESTHVLGFTP